MSNRKSNGSGKGYYIALVLCAAVIGVSGYLYYRNDTPENLDSKPAAVQDGDAQMEGSTANQTGKPATDATSGKAESQPGEKKLKTAAPLSGETVAEYAMECLSYNQTTRDWRVHNGVDIAAEAGTQVLAAAEGTVYTVYEDEAMGTTVVIRHQDGYVTRYASLDAEVSVKPGEDVKLGQAIGCVGQTALMESALGDHLHFAVTCNDRPMDPQEFLELN